MAVMGLLGVYLEICQWNSYCSFAESFLTNYLALPGNHVLEITIEAAASWPQFFAGTCCRAHAVDYLGLLTEISEFHGSILDHAF